MYENETKGNENEFKGVQFPAAETPLIELIGAANRQSPVIARKLGCFLTNAKTTLRIRESP